MGLPQESSNDQIVGILDRLAATVEKDPNQVAIVAGRSAITRRHLANGSDLLATRLRLLSRGDAPGVIGVHLSRSIELLVSMFAIWKAGGAYLPLDPEQPDSRLKHMVADANAQIVIADTRFRDIFRGPRTVSVTEDGEPITKDQFPAYDVVGPGSHAAYVVYTSGSTGRPKGVIVPHIALANFADVVTKLAPPAAERTVAWVTSPAFDMSLKAVTLLANGSVLHVVPDDLRMDPAACVDYLAAHRVDVLPCTPSLVIQLIDAGLLDRVGSVDRPLFLWLGGEQVTPDLWSRLRTNPAVRALNMYGPTECTIDASIAWIDEHETPNIGRPVQNMRLHVMNDSGAQVGTGDIGEIAIDGVGLALGYVNQPARTAERFVAASWGSPGTRMYRTGDLGRRLADGTIEFVGRLDDQVKVRGYRIEPGEIEACLRDIDNVRDVVVVAPLNGDGEPYLHAYLSGRPVDVEQLRSALADTLPGYMVPSTFTWLDHLPLTANGKVDRAALRQSTVAAPERTEPPRQTTSLPSDIESAVSAAWQELLGTKSVGVRDDFFAIGGHSLLAIRLAARLRKVVGHKFPVRLIFENHTVAEQAAALISLAGESERPSDTSNDESGVRPALGTTPAPEK